METFESRLTGGHPNSLGNTEEVVAHVLSNPARFDELFNCYFSDDETVRLRTSSAIKRVCIANKALVIPYIDRLQTDIAAIDQASTQWTLSKLYELLEKDLTAEQHAKALDLMKENLVNHDDWIVLNTTMDTLRKWAKKDDQIKQWLVPHLKRLSAEDRKSVASKAKKLLLQVAN